MASVTHLPLTTVKVERAPRNPNVHYIRNQSGTRKQVAWGFKPSPEGEGKLRRGQPLYFKATWSGIGWDLKEEIPPQNW